MPGSPNDNSKSDIEALYLLIIVMAIAFVAILWWLFRPELVLPIFTVALAELKVLNLVGLGDPEAADRIQGYFTGRYDAHTIPWAEFSTLWSRASGVGKWITVAMLAGIIAYLWKNMKGDNYKGAYSLNTLALLMSTWFRQGVTSARFKPNEGKPEVEPAMTPMEWLIHHKIAAPDCKLDNEACASELSKQLGVPWMGVDEAPLHVKCLAVMMGYHAMVEPDMKVPVPGMGKVQVSENFRQELALAFANNPPGADRDKALRDLIAPKLANADLVAKINKVAAGHAWTSTALIALLTHARKRAGVLAWAEFTWIKEIDRPLSYVLNNVGRSAHHVEGSGAIAHFDAERIGKRKLPEPRVDQAVWGVQEYLNNHNIDPERFLKLQAQD